MKLKKLQLYQIFLYLIILLLFIGGIIGLLKKTVVGYESFSLNTLFGIQGQDPDLEIVFIYSVLLAIFEIVSAISLVLGVLTKRLFLLYIGIIVISISAVGCVVAIVLGDLFAIISLIARIVALFLLISSGTKTQFSKRLEEL